MLFTEVISNKKNKCVHSPKEIQFLVESYVSGHTPDYQMASWLMAALLNGLNDEETFHLTDEIIKSGSRLDFSDCSPSIDKHSTGGVGDKTSLIVGPIVASVGVCVPMISGRSLGHTGGTADKLESIPGYITQLTLSDFKSKVREHKLSIISQTEDLCPADKKMYALRDVTSTIDSIPLICASIMSKKIAEGVGSIVLDIKYGSGAFMKTTQSAESLAQQLIHIGKKFNRNVAALITNMNQPLGMYAGNALEVVEAVQILKSDLENDTKELSLELAAAMFLTIKMVSNIDDGRALANKALSSGSAFSKFEELCKIHGGRLSDLPTPTQSFEVLSENAGFIQFMETREIGLAAVVLGAGRIKSSDKINPVAGIKFYKKVGDQVKKGEPLFTLYGSDTKNFEEAKKRLISSVQFSQNPIKKDPLIWKRII